jgi:AcrR family transcriptional regulator
MPTDRSTRTKRAPAEPLPAEAAETLLRKVPMQRRGHARVDLILDAAEKLFSQQGVELTSTNEIAAFAKTAKGSLYQFFEHKDAIVEALLARYTIGLRRVNATTMSPEAAKLPLPELIDRIIDPLVAFRLIHPAYIPVYAYAVARSGTLSYPDGDLHNANVSLVDQMVSYRQPQLSAKERKAQVMTLVDMTNALLDSMQRAPASERDQRLVECKRAVVAYVEAVEGKGQNRSK